MFGDVGHARTNAAILLMLIATTSSHTCTKPMLPACANFILSFLFVTRDFLAASAFHAAFHKMSQPQNVSFVKCFYTAILVCLNFSIKDWLHNKAVVQKPSRIQPCQNE